MARPKKTYPDTLTDQEQDFVVEYIRLGEAKAAYKAAGFQAGTEGSYSTMSGNLFRAPHIQSAIKMAQRVAAGVKDRTELSEDVNERLVLSGMLRQARLEGKGASHQARVQAWMHLGRYLGMWQDNTNVNSPELARMMREAEERVAGQRAAGMVTDQGTDTALPDISVIELAESYTAPEYETEEA